MAKVELTPATEKQIDRLPKTIRLRLLGIVKRLEQWPRVSGAKPLKGNLAGHFRIRTGSYRVQFHLEGEIVVIEKIAIRDRFYED